MMSQGPESYILEKTPEQPNAVLSAEIVQFWVKEGALSAEMATSRVSEVYYLARHQASHAIVGVCTIKPLFVESMQLAFYNCRSFVGKSHRSQFVVKQLIIATYDGLNSAYDPEGSPSQPVGLFLDIENDLLKQRKGAVWSRGDLHITFIGLKPNGNHIRIAYFTGAVLGN